jgi:glycosyltransferase involved in cell wall biosynthesis
MENINMKEKILIISPQLPSNPNGGAKVLQDRFQLLSKDYDLFMLTKHKDLVIPVSLNYFKFIHIIQKTKPFNIIAFFYRYFVASISLMYYIIVKEKIKIVQIEFYDGLAYSFFLAPLKLLGVHIFYTAHDIQCLYYKKGLLKFKLVKFIEKICFSFFVDTIFVWGKDDLNELISWGLNPKKIKIIAPIIELQNSEKWHINKLSMDFVFMGSINHKPNKDAINYIFENLWSEIKELLPNSKLYLILGSDKNNLEIKDPSIINCGFVNDPIDIMKKCNIFLAPIISGTGIKIKIIESFGFGIPIVSTTLGFRNFDDIDKNIVLLANSKNEFLEKIKEVISHQEKLNRISEYQRNYYEDNFSRKNLGLYEIYYSYE